jgi:hypothetical protein
MEKILDKQIRHSGMEKWRRSSTSRSDTAAWRSGEGPQQADLVSPDGTWREVPEQAQVRPLETYSRDFAE